MSFSAAVPAAGNFPVDWWAVQDRYFRGVPVALDQAIAAGTCLSERQVKRLRFCESPVQLHQGYRIARITQNPRLVDAYAREAQGLPVASAPGPEKGTNMDVYLDMKKKLLRLDELEYRLLKEGMLSPDEHAEFAALCEAIARDALTLRGSVTEEA